MSSNEREELKRVIRGIVSRDGYVNLRTANIMSLIDTYVESQKREAIIDTIKRLDIDPDHNYRTEAAVGGGHYVIPVYEYVERLQSTQQQGGE